MMRAFAFACAGVVIAVAGTAGCTSAATADPTRSDRSPRAAASDAADLDGRGRELTESEQILVRRAEQTLVQKCMAAKGFTYWIGPLPTVDDLKGDGYVLTDVGWAKRHGYGSRLQEKVQDLQRDDPNHAYANALPRTERVRYSETLEGGPSGVMLTAELPGGGTIRTPRDSCLSDAKDQLYGDFEAWFRAEKTATNLTPLYVPALVEDQRFTGAVEAWSACMRDAGHDYPDPSTVREKLPELTAGLTEEKAYAAEVGLAVAEATCATETSLAETARALDLEYRDKKLRRYREDIAAYQRMSRTALNRAEDITGSTA
jgi:hypothetical protein